MAVHTLQATFSRGELTPRLHARTDIQDYAQSLATCLNWLVMRQGGVQRRPGFIWINNLRDSTALARLFEFEFNEEQAYCLLFNGGYVRFYTLGGEVSDLSLTITGISKASPGVVSYTGTDPANGDRVVIDGVVGMTEVNGREFTVANVNAGANTFELSGIDTSGYTTWSSGGTASRVYEVAHPYSDADLFGVQIAQSGDTVYKGHNTYDPRKLVRSSETSWAISTIEFDDGPYLDEDAQGTTLTPAGTGALHPIMTSLTAPSGTAANSDADADAWEVFDANDTTTSDIAATLGNWSYDLGAGNSAICDAYWIRAGSTLGNAPSAWTFEGSADGSTYIVLDTQIDENTWGRDEVRFYEFKNAKAYRYHRLVVIDVDGGTGLQVSSLGWHKEGDSQTAVNLTASAVTGINGGAGFKTTDVGRTVRLMDRDGHWRWARIIAWTSTTVVTVKIYGHSLSSLGAISHWKMSAWSVDDGFPGAVGFFEDRLAWGGSTSEPLKAWMSKPADYENHGIADVISDDDAINVRVTGGRLNKIGFLEEMDPLVAGTPGSMRVIGPLDSGVTFSNTNIQQKSNGVVGSAAIQPLILGITMLFVDRYLKRVYEFAFDLNSNSYIPRELSIENDHLLASGITECSFQQQPDNLCWYPVGNGRAAVLTYEQAQRIAGWADIRVAGGGTADGFIESTASIPSTGGDVTYAVVKRTIDGATVRSIEYLAPFFDTGDDLADAVYCDASGTVTGTGLTGVTGLWRLRNESVGVLADGVDVGDATVSATGVLALADCDDNPPASASTITFGKRYTSRLVTLRAPTAGNQDGSALGRKMRVDSVQVDLLNAKGLQAGTIVRGMDSLRDLPRPAIDAAAGALNTGMFEVLVDGEWGANGQVVLQTDRLYPATVRAVQLELEGEP